MSGPRSAVTDQRLAPEAEPPYTTGSQPDAGDDERATDLADLTLLLDGPQVWTVAEIASRLGADVDAVDSIARLRSAGLVDGVEHLVLAAQAAREAGRLLEATD